MSKLKPSGVMIRLSPELHKSLKIATALRGETIQDAVRKCIMDYVRETSKNHDVLARLGGGERS